MVEVIVNGCNPLYKQFNMVDAYKSAMEYKKHIVKDLGFKPCDVKVASFPWEVEDLSDGTKVYFQTLKDACRALIYYSKLYNRDNFTIHELWN